MLCAFWIMGANVGAEIKSQKQSDCSTLTFYIGNDNDRLLKLNRSASCRLN